MLAALAGGRALPATDLARHARIKPAAATAHLYWLIDLRLLTRTAGRGLRPAPDYQPRIDSWRPPL